MRIACLQFAPQVGDVHNNLNRADAVLSKANIDNIDLLVLPELAFSGYNFRSLQHITPFLEPTTSGITSLWARTTALKHNCFVVAGYPEKVDVTPKWPTSPEYYNSAITVNREGETIANYRKSFLYYTDETWALEGPDGFYDGHIEGLGNVAMGICKWPTKSQERMDLNPYKFESPWTAWEFANHVIYRESNLVILSMAWLTREDPRSYSRTPREPDMETLSYWLARMEPVIRNEGEEEIIVVFANRSGVEEEAVYAGTSAILGIQAGEVKVYGILGRGERELLVVDTNKRPQMMLISEPKPKPEKTKPKERERLTSKRYAEAKPSPSSSSSFNSPCSVDSNISIDTANTSAEPATVIPAIGNVSLTSTSPVDHHVAHSYYGRKSTPKPRKPTPTPEAKPQKPTPTIDPQRERTPIDLQRERTPIEPRGTTPSPEHRLGTMPSPEYRRGTTPSREYQRGPTPSQEPKPRKPTPDVHRGITPALDNRQTILNTSDETLRKEPPPSVFPRPSSPKSRNTSRSRSRMEKYGDSPLLGSNATWEQFTPPVVKDDDEIERILREINDDDEIVAIESDSDIIEIIDEKLLRMQRVTGSKAPSPEMVEKKMSRMSSRQGQHIDQVITNGHKEERVLSTRPIRADTAKERPSNSTSMNPEEWDLSFTRNPLGPRSKHVSPRPKSTFW